MMIKANRASIAAHRARFAVPAVFGVAALTLSVAACGAFGPSREPPKMPSPGHYAVDAEPAQMPPADGVAQQLAIGARPVPKWWVMYQSDVLDALVEEGLAKSPSLAAAQSTPTIPTTKAAEIPYTCTAAADRNGPMNMPIRIDPPSVDIARARYMTGTASVR